MATVLCEDSTSYSLVLDPHGVELQVEYDGPAWDEYGMRRQYVLHVRTETQHYVDNTIRSGVRDAIDARRAWCVAVSYLGACEESRNSSNGPGENADMFPGWVMEIVSPVIEELTTHADEIRHPNGV